MTENLTIRQIEQSLGIPNTLPDPSSPLEKWYASVRDKRVADFDIDDLCIACRQNVFPEYVVPVALRELANDSLVGHKYDGELLLALRGLPSEYWASHPEQAGQVKTMFDSIRDCLGEEFRLFANELMAAIGAAIPG